MLSPEQVRQLFQELKIPAARIQEGSPIDIVCPFIELHQLQLEDRRHGCRLYFDRYPHLDCFHSHCWEELDALNVYLRLKITGTTEKPSTSADGAPAGPPPDYSYAHRIGRSRPKILARYQPKSWTPAPIPMPAPEFLARLGAFKKTDLIWIGQEWDSGAPRCSIHFRTLAQWRAEPPPPF
jgi:hypothetical protein